MSAENYPESPGRVPASPGRLARAYCGHCRRMVALRKTGTLREHFDPVTVSNAADNGVTRMLCRGTNKTPESAQREAGHVG